ncbi:MAG: hypothetical protein ABFR82_13565 [Nitrospirota bacterium]
MIRHIIIVLIILITGCASLDEQKRMDSLDAVINSYENAIRWGYYELTENYIKKPDKSHYTGDYSSMRDYKVTSYEVLGGKVENDGMQAMQTVEIKYYHIRYLIEKVMIDKQLWEYDVSEKKWFLKSGLPVFQD